ncbi:DUF7840 domain-containing protein [Spongiibacter pelagi]
MPVDTIRRVVDEGLVKEVEFRPSKQLQFEQLIGGLSESEKDLVVALAEGREAVDGQKVSALAQTKQQVLMAAYRLLRYQHNKSSRDSEIAKRSLTLLRASQTLGEMPYASAAAPTRPDLGHPTSQFNVGAGVLEDQEFIDLQWRISYHDTLDPLAGYPVGAGLEMLRVGLRWQDDQLKLQELVPVDIRSLSPRSQFAKGLSWGVKGGLERIPSAEHSLKTGLQGDVGGSWRELGGTSYVLVRPRLEYNPESAVNWQLGLGGVVGQLWQGERISAELSAEYLDFTTAASRTRYQFGMNLKLQHAQSLRLSLDYSRQQGEEFTEAKLAWRRYF